MTQAVGIVGGGLAGLYAASLLQRAGVDHVLLEARGRLGGRLLSVRPDAPAVPDGTDTAFDLGATWYWPDMQPAFAALIDSLGLRSFGQWEFGDMLVEDRQPGRTSRVRGDMGQPPSLRLVGGMASLVDALRSRIPSARLRVAHHVDALVATPDGVRVEAVDTEGRRVPHDVGHVLLALPPRLAQSTLRLEVPLPVEVAADWAGSATWMAPHAKYLAVYRSAFWRERGLSGAARSLTGPMVEIHDASAPEGLAALFGFVGVPAEHRARIPDKALRGACRAQLVRLFGESAAEPVAEWLQDWSREPFTATHADRHAQAHPTQAARQVVQGPWRDRLTGIASEWSLHYPGYAAGALEAAEAGVARLLANRTADRPLAGRPHADRTLAD